MYYFMDKKGAILNEPYQGWAIMENGYTLVYKDYSANEVYLYDENGIRKHKLFNMELVNFDKIKIFSSENVWVASPSGWTSDYVLDTNLKAVVKARSIYHFNNGLAQVEFEKPNGNGLLYGYMDKTGEVKIIFGESEW